MFAFKNRKFNLFFRSVVWTILITFISQTIGLQPASAQTYIQSLPAPGAMVNLSQAFNPVLMKGIKTYPENPFRFDFFVDPGEVKKKSGEIARESEKQIKYFLASLTVPEDQLWVNLSPTEKDRIMPTGFGVTEMGRDLLAQDYILKQISASLLDPSKPQGEEFWKKIYARAENSGVDVSGISNFNKVWIIPDTADVYSKDGNAFVINSHLKVMMEEDYKTLEAVRKTGEESDTSRVRRPASDVSSIMRSAILPSIEKEVNEGENFAILRQIYNAMILATWFKRHLRDTIFGRVYVGQNKVNGIDVEDKNIKEEIYQQYLAAFKKGAFNFIREDYDAATEEMIPRKYFAGGVDFASSALVPVYHETSTPASFKQINLRPTDFMGRPFYKVSSVVISPMGVDWYTSMNLAPPMAAASSILAFKETAIGARLNRLFEKVSISGVSRVLFASLLLIAGLGFSLNSQAAKITYETGRGAIVQVQEGDNLGKIISAVYAQQKKIDPNYQGLLSKPLFNPDASGQRPIDIIAKAMDISSPNSIQNGDVHVIPQSFLAGQPVVHGDLGIQQVVVIGHSSADSGHIADAARTLRQLPDVLLGGWPLTSGFGSDNLTTSARKYEHSIARMSANEPQLSPVVPVTFSGLVITGLAWAGRRSLVTKTAQAFQFIDKKRATAPAGAVPVEKELKTQAIMPAAVIEETPLTDLLSAQIRSMSLDYLQYRREVKKLGSTFSQRLADTFRAKLTASGKMNSRDIDLAVVLFSGGLASGIETAGEQSLDRSTLDEKINAKAAELALGWELNQQTLDATPELEAFIEEEINAVVKARLADFTAKIEAALTDKYLTYYDDEINFALTAESNPNAIVKEAFNGIGRNLTDVLQTPVTLRGRTFVTQLRPLPVTEDSVRALLLAESLELQTVDANLNAAAKNLAAEIGAYLTHWLTDPAKGIKITTKSPQPDPAATVQRIFVPFLSRYLLTGLYQRYNAQKIEELLQKFTAEMAQKYAGQSIDTGKVRKDIANFVNGELKSAIEANIAQAGVAFRADLLSSQNLQGYHDDIDVAVQEAKAYANGSGVQVIAVVAQAAAEIVQNLRDNQGLVAMPFFMRAISAAMAEETANSIEEQTLPEATPTAEAAADTTPSGETSVETNPAGETLTIIQPRPISTVSFVGHDMFVLGLTAMGLIATGNTDTASAMMALASPFMFRAGYTGSLIPHEFSHAVAGGPKAWTLSNFLGNAPLGAWIDTLKPLFGQVPAKLSVLIPSLKGKPVLQWTNRLTGFATSLGILGAAAFSMYGLWRSGMQRESIATFPLVYGAAVTAFKSLQSDIIQPLKGQAGECEFNCGVEAIVSKKKSNVILQPGVQKDDKAIGQVADIRGQQAGGFTFQVVHKGNTRLVGSKGVNSKQGNLPEYQDREITKQKIIAKLKGYEGTDDYDVFLSHKRYGTSSPPADEETHPFEWMSHREVEVWYVNKDGQLVHEVKPLNIRIVHNGDFDEWLLYGRYISNADMAFWLERVLHTKGKTKGDSEKIAGVLDYLRTKGIWDASVRFSYYETIATSFDDVFDGKFEKVITNQAEIDKDPTTPPHYEVLSKDTSLSDEKIEEIGSQMRNVFAREARNLMEPGDTDITALWARRDKLIGVLADDGLKGIDIVQGWDKQTRLRFAETALKAFLFNDEYEASKILIQRARGSFGLGIISTLFRGLIFVSDGQPLQMAFDKESGGENFYMTSEPSALKIKMHNEKWMQYRLSLKQDIGFGEIAVVSGSEFEKVRIYSRTEGRELTEQEKRDRLVPLRNNHYISELPNLNSDDPVGDEVRDLAPVLNDIKEDWADENSMNRVTGRNVLGMLNQKKIEKQIRNLSNYTGLERKISRKADAIALQMRRELAARLGQRLSDTANWERKLQLAQAAAVFSPYLEGAISEVLDFAQIDRVIRARAKELSDAMLSSDENPLTAEGLRLKVSAFVSRQLNAEISRQLDLATERVRASVEPWMDSISVDMIRHTRRASESKDPEKMKAAGRAPFQRVADKWRESGVAPGVQMPKRGADVFFMGLEISQWVGEQAAQDIQLMFPDFDIRNGSSNKVLKDPYGVGIDDDTIVFAVSQSGQTFPTLNSALMLEKLQKGRLIAVTGDWDTPMAQAVGQELKPDSDFQGRIISNLTGFRPSEAVSLTGDATHASFTELFIRLSKDFLTLYPNLQPNGMTLTSDDIAKLEAKRDETIADAEKITGIDREGNPIETKENQALNNQAKTWGLHVLDDPFSQIISEVHLFTTLVFGFTVVGLLFKFMPLVISLLSMIPYIGPVFGLLTGFFAFLNVVPIAGLLTYAWYKSFPYMAQVVMRKLTGRTVLARTGKRTIVFGDTSWIHQSLEAFGSKLNSLSKKATAVDFHGANPDDHMISRFGHRVVRGTLIWLGFVDERMGSDFEDWKSAISMTGQQAKGVQNFGVGAEIIGVGRARAYNANATDVDITISGEAEKTEHKLGLLLENRGDSLMRLMAGQYFLYRMMRYVSTLDLSPGWRRFWPWAWKMNRTQSGPRIATTRSSQKARDYTKFIRTKTIPSVLRAPEHGTIANTLEAMTASSSALPKQDFTGSNSKTMMIKSGSGENAPGGINLDPSYLKMRNNGSSTGSSSVIDQIDHPAAILDPVAIKSMPPDRFVPLVIRVVPVSGVETFLNQASP